MFKKYWPLIIALVIGSLLRLVMISSYPVGLNWDEISHGYNAYSILKTGMDQWGERLPIINFRAYGDYPTALNLYLTAPFIYLFGLSELSIRLPHAILGILTILSSYFLAWGIFRRRDLSGITAILVSITPWYFFTSRFVLQSNLSVFLMISSMAFFVNRKSHKYYFSISLILFTLTLFSYHTTRIFSPLFLIALILIYRRQIKHKLIYIFSILFILASAFIVLSPGATARGNVLFILDQGAIAKIEHQRNTSKMPPLLTKAVYNRPVYFFTEFGKKYFSYFTPKFLFLEGGTQYQFSVPRQGLIFLIGMPFFYLGLISLLKGMKSSGEFKMLFAWLLLAPIPASLTNESYTVLRASAMLPVTEILISMGLLKFAGQFKNKYKILILLVFFAMELLYLGNYLKIYFGDYATRYSWSWQYGYKDVAVFVKDSYDKYDYFVVTKKYGEPHEFLLFYLGYNPAGYLFDANKISYYQDKWWWVDRFDKFWFVNDWEVKLNPPELSVIQLHFITESGENIDCRIKKCALITSPGNFPPGWRSVSQIKYLNGDIAFEIYDNLNTVR